MFESFGMSVVAIVLTVIGVLMYTKLKKWYMFALACVVALVISTGGNTKVLNDNIESVTKRYESTIKSKDELIASLEREISYLIDDYKGTSQYYVGAEVLAQKEVIDGKYLIKFVATNGCVYDWVSDHEYSYDDQYLLSMRHENDDIDFDVSKDVVLVVWMNMN